jgi:hypothetical protein
MDPKDTVEYTDTAEYREAEEGLRAEAQAAETQEAVQLEQEIAEVIASDEAKAAAAAALEQRKSIEEMFPASNDDKVGE